MHKTRHGAGRYQGIRLSLILCFACYVLTSKACEYLCVITGIFISLCYEMNKKMDVQEVCTATLREYIPYLRKNLPRSLAIYTSAQVETSLKYEENQKVTVLKTSNSDEDPAFVFHRMECYDSLYTIFCPELKNELVPVSYTHLTLPTIYAV